MYVVLCILYRGIDNSHNNDNNNTNNNKLIAYNINTELWVEVGSGSLGSL